jgi:hypothetical protein
MSDTSTNSKAFIVKFTLDYNTWPDALIIKSNLTDDVSITGMWGPPPAVNNLREFSWYHIYSRVVGHCRSNEYVNYPNPKSDYKL